MPDEDLQPQTSEESVSIARFSAVGGNAPLSPKMGGPTLPEAEPEPAPLAAPVDMQIILPDGASPQP